MRKVVIIIFSFSLAFILSWIYCSRSNIFILGKGQWRVSLTSEESIKRGVFVDSFACITGNGLKYGLRTPWLEHSYIIPGIYFDEAEVVDSFYHFLIPLSDDNMSSGKCFYFRREDGNFSYINRFQYDGPPKYNLDLLLESFERMDTIMINVYNLTSGDCQSNSTRVDSIVFVKASIIARSLHNEN